MRNISIILIVLTLLFACKKKESVNAVEEDSWKPVREITLADKNASYCYSNGELLLIRSLNSMSVFDANHTLKTRYLNFNSSLYKYRHFPMSNPYVITIFGLEGYI
ncbi:MAG: hypothetical protein R2852_09990 [Bacteroidia bacterium]